MGGGAIYYCGGGSDGDREAYSSLAVDPEFGFSGSGVGGAGEYGGQFAVDTFAHKGDVEPSQR